MRPSFFLGLVVFLVTAGLLLISGIYTVDYGVHWDEAMSINLVAKSFQPPGHLLPGRYTYPSNLYSLGLLTALPKWIASGFDGVGTAEWVGTPKYRFLLRFVLYVLTNVANVWAGLLAFAILGRRWSAGLVAFLLLASSFEFHYHSRWIAVDAWMAQFGILSLLLSVLAVQNPEKKKWICLAVIAVGLSAATKYPGGLLVIPLCTAVGLRSRKLHHSWFAILGSVVLAGVSSFAVYLIATPGTILEHSTFVSDVSYEMRHYRVEGHFGYSTTPGIRNAEHIVDYLAFSGLSYFGAISLVLFATAWLGGIWLYRRRRDIFWVLAPFPFLYVLYFAQQRAVIVRNYLILLPCFAVFATLGLIAACDHAKLSARLRFGLMGIIAMFVCVDAGWLVYADMSIVRRNSRDFKAEIATFLQRTPQPVSLSPRVAALAGKDIHSQPGQPRTLVFMSDFKDPLKIPANIRGKYEVLPDGPFEINFDYYPTWVGDDRLLVVPTKDLEAINAP